MGAWGERALDNDDAGDWAAELEGVEDLSLVESAFDEIESVGADYVEYDVAANALAACEVLARLQGHHGYRDASSEVVDEWVAAHRLKPSPGLLKRASAAIDRVLGADSELRELWDEADDRAKWRASVEDLRQRMRA